MQGGHELIFRVKGQHIHPGLVGRSLVTQTSLARSGEQGSLGGIALYLPLTINLLQLAVIAE